MILSYPFHGIYSMSHETPTQSFCHNLVKYEPIFKILSHKKECIDAIFQTK